MTIYFLFITFSNICKYSESSISSFSCSGGTLFLALNYQCWHFLIFHTVYLVLLNWTLSRNLTTVSLYWKLQCSTHTINITLEIFIGIFCMWLPIAFTAIRSENWAFDFLINKTQLVHVMSATCIQAASLDSFLHVSTMSKMWAATSLGCR